MFRPRPCLLVPALCALLAGCVMKDRDHRLLISVPDQRMVLYTREKPVATWLVSTSKFGIGDRPGSYATPLGKMEIAKKIGGEAPAGAVFHSRRWTGEIVRPNAPGRDPIVSRILRLKGLERRNGRSYDRNIYIHGTPEEAKIGQPASFGCVRMKSRDVIALYDEIGLGAQVQITMAPLPHNLPFTFAAPSPTPGPAPSPSPAQ